MDAKEASKKVRDYFYEVHGQYGIFNFRIENVIFDKKRNLWSIECSFLPSLMAQEKERVYYKVIIDAQGKIENVEKVLNEKEALLERIKK